MAKKPKNGAAPTSADDDGGLDPVERAKREAADEARLGAVQLAAKTLTGDIVDFILNKLKWEQDTRPWSERSEAQQRDTISSCESNVEEMVRKAVEVIASAGQPCIRATLDQVTIKDGIKATLIMSKLDEQRHNLFDAQGMQVVVVVADPSVFTGRRKPVDVKPDQGDLERVLVTHSDENADRAADRADTDPPVPGKNVLGAPMNGKVLEHTGSPLN